MEAALPRVLSAEQDDLLRLLGYIYLQHGRAAQSAILFHAIHALRPDDRFAARALACSWLRSGKAREALPLLDLLIERGDRSPLVHLLRGQALSQMGRRAESFQAMRLFVSARAGAGEG
ncbi:MAG: tetratricopeptide repeat protein [Noviherbaspirillum sp.]